MKILVVEDEPRTAQALELGLTECGYEVTVTHRGDDAVELICTSAFDAVVMDIMLPGIDGLTAVRTLRQRSNSTPILLLSARGEVNQRIEGLNTGADDYVSKPFAMGEIVARLQALTRRGGEARAILLRVGDLTPREFKLLEALMRNQGTVCPRSMLLQEVWEYDFDPGTNLVDVYIRKLREKVDNDFDRQLLHTARGIGYVIRE
jgi:DNA-binding response OmpR family regulator